jgi:prepilin-type processing-associated H-X9-DG protein
MLLPALNKARQAAKTVQCASQMRQVALSILLYAQDNKNWCPPVLEKNSVWTDSLCMRRLYNHKYVKDVRILYCPEDPNREISLENNGFTWPTYFWGYTTTYTPTIYFGMPYYPTPANPAYPWYHGFNRFAGKPILGERHFANPFGSGSPPDMYPNSPRQTWHNGGSNLAFGDGHVTWIPDSIKWAGTKNSAWDPDRPDVTP